MSRIVSFGLIDFLCSSQDAVKNSVPTALEVCRLSEESIVPIPLNARINKLFTEPVLLTGLLDELPIGILLLDENRNILLMNPIMEALTGFSRDEVLGLPCRDVVRSNLCTRQCPAREAAEGIESVTREGNIVNRDRRTITVRQTSAAIKKLKQTREKPAPK